MIRRALLVMGVCLPFFSAAQHTSFVNPFIGTTHSAVETRWGNEGGTYPGAVVPSGFVQLTPDAYDYRDSTVRWFTCAYHNSGFPDGSSGGFAVMPFKDSLYRRPFSHLEEHAEPGYYRLRLSDDGTLIEATTTVRTGIFRITFPPGVPARIFIGDFLGGAFRFSEAPIDTAGRVFSFKGHTILVKVSVSTVSSESAAHNIDVECNEPFDALRAKALARWEQSLSVADVHDSSVSRKAIFYTALYHSLLIPWVISDVDGNYRGEDRLVHHVGGRVEYGNFSPWDEFRSLYPLLTLLFPQKASDMVQSMLDIYQQRGHLPTGPMTGNHAVPFLVDAYRKGIPMDTNLLVDAIRKPFVQDDMAVFRRLGYIPFDHPESVTRTVEYAYDDWALEQLLPKASSLHPDAYRELFYAPALLLLPRKGDVFKTDPGTSGYKEGSAWIYSYFVPQDPAGLIRLMGGSAYFSFRLDSALRQGQILFDNEPVFHIPYLFNEAGFSPLTQEWVRTIMRDRYHDSPGGLPGNDDMGAMSSWYVFSAMGVFPVCPGRAQYAIGTPYLREVTLHLANGQHWVIRSTGDGGYIQSLRINGQPYRRTVIPHTLVEQGGEMLFNMGPAPGRPLQPETPNEGVFSLFSPSLSSSRVKPGEPSHISFSIHNPGADGTQRVTLSINGKPLTVKNCRVPSGETVRDTIVCRLYHPGKVSLRLNGGVPLSLDVLRPAGPLPDEPDITTGQITPVIKAGDSAQIYFRCMNPGWETKTFYLPLQEDSLTVYIDTIRLQPGEQQDRSLVLRLPGAGIHTLRIGGWRQVFKIYGEAPEACVLDLDGQEDHSGFHNNALVEGTTLRVPSSPSLDIMGDALTMMLWVYPTGENEGLTDIFTKGDDHVLQVGGNRTLTFFAGGWGRGDCTVDLPKDWMNHWHHIAGVCSPDGLRVYIDGTLKGYTHMEKPVNLTVLNSTWMIGGNDEFPGQRLYRGNVAHPMLFQSALDSASIRRIYERGR